MYDFDLVVIGAGSAGISSAILGNNLGKRVALVEHRKIGGDCTWYGCVPSKTLIKSAQVAHIACRAEEFGLHPSGGYSLDASGVMAHVRAVRDRVYQGERPEVFEARGIRVLIGAPAFVDAHTVRIGEHSVTARSFIIATGSSPAVPSIEGLLEVPYLTNETVFDLETVPESMVVLGGGPIGIELAAALNRLGVRVTLLLRRDRILPREDEELASMLMEHLAGEGIIFVKRASPRKLSVDHGEIVMATQDAGGNTGEIRAGTLLVATGRTPNVDGLDLDAAGVMYSPQGICTTSTLQTTVPNIYACGDVIGSYQFSHVAEYHAEIAVPNALLPLPMKRKVDDRKVVWATFTDPELARTGMTEAEARERHGDHIRVYRHFYRDVDRAKTDLAEVGMSKFICDRRGRLLGVHIMGEHAADLLHETQLARMLGIPFGRIHTMIHVYPTYSDMVRRPAAQAYVDRINGNVFVKLLKRLKS